MKRPSRLPGKFTFRSPIGDGPSRVLIELVEDLGGFSNLRWDFDGDSLDFTTNESAVVDVETRIRIEELY